ncbi:hypothetical protein GCM10011399_34430 [Subtercola lobariae]|uniref:Uncharacterized protein n=1 Tax=Subtercola lobariae TaxID=1588641 RepID=A0A917BDE6_9MICO|nr:hypothetical protein GCM10011399_34430 [Subtercola lobariae]
MIITVVALLIAGAGIASSISAFPDLLSDLPFGIGGSNSIANQLAGAGFTSIDPADIGQGFDLEFTGNGYDVGVTLSDSGPHGPTAEYLITSIDPTSSSQ